MLGTASTHFQSYFSIPLLALITSSDISDFKAADTPYNENVPTAGFTTKSPSSTTTNQPIAPQIYVYLITRFDLLDLL